MSRAAASWLGAVAAALLVTGLFLAVAQPGDLGADDGDEQAGPAATSTTLADDFATPTTGVETDTTMPPVPTTDATSGGAPTGADGDGSGLGVGGAGTAQPGELVDSGHDALAVPGLLLAGAGMALATRRRRA